MTKSSSSSSPPTSSSPGDPIAGAAPTALEQRGREGPPENTINLCGEICPFTFVRTKLALEELPMGAMLRVIVDHEPATRNIPRSAAEWGQEVVGVIRVAPRIWAIDLRKRVR